MTGLIRRWRERNPAQWLYGQAAAGEADIP